VNVGGSIAVHLKRDRLASAKLFTRAAVDDVASLKREGIVAVVKGDVP
jgi:hypothetical protein